MYGGIIGRKASFFGVAFQAIGECIRKKVMSIAQGYCDTVRSIFTSSHFPALRPASVLTIYVAPRINNEL